MRASDHRTAPSGPSRLRAAAGATAVAAVSVVGLVLGSGSAAAATTTTVLDSDLVACADAPSATGFCQEAGGGGTVRIVPDANAILGNGSLELATEPNDAYTYVANQSHDGEALSSITTLAYQTYLDELADSPVQVTSLAIGLDPEGDGGDTKYILWEPTYTGAQITTDTWQTWSPSATATGSGGWWTFPADVSTGATNSLGFAQYTASFADVKQALPNAKVRDIAFNQGTGNPGLTTLVDGLTINDTTYDFEPPAATGPADLSVAVTGPTFVASGSGADVQVVVTNNSTTNPSGPTTATALAPGYTITDPGAGTLNDNGSVTYAVPYLAPGGTATYTFSTDPQTGFRFGAAGAIVYPATGQPDGNLFNNLSIVPLITR